MQNITLKKFTLTALLHGVTSLQVIAGPGRVFLATIRALHAVDLAAKGLQGGVHTGVHGHDGGGVAIGQSLILTELRRRRGAWVVVIEAAKQVIHCSHGRSWGTGRPRGSRLSRGTLRKSRWSLMNYFTNGFKFCSEKMLPCHQIPFWKEFNNLMTVCFFFCFFFITCWSTGCLIKSDHIYLFIESLY